MEQFLIELSNWFKIKGITQKQISKDIGIAQPYVSNLLNGKIPFSKKTAHKFSEKYGLSELWLITGSGSMDGTDKTDNKETNISGNTDELIYSQQETIKMQCEQINKLLNIVERMATYTSVSNTQEPS